jgi:hypothetical protein
MVLAMPNKYDHLTERIVREIRNLLLANVTPTRNLSDDRTAECIRSIAGGPELGRVLEQANDTALCFAVREIRRESWSRKSEQDDKWSFCLIAGTLCPANQERQ